MYYLFTTPMEIFIAMFCIIISLSQSVLCNTPETHANTKSWSNIPTECAVVGTTQTCDGNLPSEIALGITDVYITNYDHGFTSTQTHVFQNKSWMRVNTLDITLSKTSTGDRINSYDFELLKNLTKLGIHSPRLDRISPLGFVGLNQLRHLDLSRCIKICSHQLVGSLSNITSLPNLKELNLEEVCTKHGRNLEFDKGISSLLQKRKIEWLNLSGTNLYIIDMHLFNGSYALKHLDLSNVSCLFDRKVRNTKGVDFSAILAQFLDKTEVLNISLLPLRRLQRFHVEDELQTHTSNYCTNWPSSLRVLNISNLFTADKYINYFGNTTMDFSNCFNKTLDTVIIAGNNLQVADLTIKLPNNLKLKYIDMSSNNMRYLSHNAWKKQVEIKHIALSNNHLYNMEDADEFELLLATFTKLDFFDISFNKLNYIPYRMFANNNNIKTMKLNGNRLNAITFKLNHFQRLRVLDIRDNYIAVIANHPLDQLSNLILKLSPSVQSDCALDVDLRNNPLVCSCESVTFIEWIISIHYNPSVFVREYNCTLEDASVVIDHKSLERVEYLCQENLIVISCLVSSLLMLAIFVGVSVKIVVIRRQKRQTELENDFIENVKKKRQYLAFLSYCNADGDLVMDIIYKQLENTLKDMIGVYDHTLCLGEKDFVPGLSIFDEIQRCLNSSNVMIFVISRSFCESEWCKTEVREACTRNKPIILIFTEDVDLDLMPPSVKNVFQTKVRAKLELQDDGQYTITPDWYKLCVAIIKLASKTFADSPKVI